MIRRYIRAARARMMREAPAFEGGRSYDIQRNDWVDWIVVPDDDPKAETVEIVPSPEPETSE